MNNKCKNMLSIRVLITILLVISIISSNITSVLAINKNAPTDVILIIDSSDSMSANDPNRLVISGVKLFIEMLPLRAEWRVGVVWFGANIPYTLPLTEIKTENDKTNFLDKIEHKSAMRGTDIGLALKQAESMLMNTGNNYDRNKLVVFFTDGAIEFSENGRTTQDSHNDVDEVLRAASGNYPIFAIGLKKDGSFDENLLNKIATQTNTLAPLIADSAEQLRDKYMEIYAMYIDPEIIEVPLKGHNNWSEYTDINMADGLVTEAIITVTPGTDAISDTELSKPNGDIVDLLNNTNPNISYRPHGESMVINLNNPEGGNWRIRFKGDEKYTVKSMIVRFNSRDLKFALIPDNNASRKVGTHLPLVAYVTNKDNEKIENNSFLKRMNVTLAAFDESDTKIDELPMFLNEVDASYKLEFKLPDGTNAVKFYANFDGNNYHEKIGPVEVDIVIPPPPVSKNEKYKTTVTSFIRLGSKDVDFSEQFDYYDMEALTYEMTNNATGSKESLEDGIKSFTADSILKGKKEVYTVTAANPEGNLAEIALTVTYRCLFVWAVFLAILLLLALIVAFFAVKWNWFGQSFGISEFSMIFKANGIPTPAIPIPIRVLVGGNLRKVMPLGKAIDVYIRESGSMMPNFAQMSVAEKAILNKVLFKKKGNHIAFRNNLSKEDLENVNIINTMIPNRLTDGHSFKVVINNGTTECEIRYQE